MPRLLPILPQKAWAWMGLILIALVCLVIRARLASMPLERDEGEYACMAEQILAGKPPYLETYGMKFPGTYLAYAGILSVLGKTDVAIRWGLILLNGATTFVIFLCGRKMVSSQLGLWSAAVFMIVSLAPSMLGITANAEHFVLLPMLLGVLFACNPPDWKNSLISGFCMGVAICMKQQGVLFAPLVLGCLLVQLWKHNNSLVHRSNVTFACIWGLGGVLPFLGIFWWMKQGGTWDLFCFWTMEYAKYYGGMWTWKDGCHHFLSQFKPIFMDHFPIGILSLLGLGLAWRKSRCVFALLLGFFVMGFLATTPGLIFRPHYFIFVLPAISFAAGIAIMEIHERFCRAFFLIILTFAFPLLMQFQILFLESPEDVSRSLYPHNAFPEVREVAQWLKGITTLDEKVGVLGSEPQLFFYSGCQSAHPYLYLYPLMEPQPFAIKMQKHLIHILEQSPPRYLVHVRIPTSWLAYPDSEPLIFKWLPEFIAQHYQQKRMIKIPSLNPKEHKEIVVYQRKGVSEK